MLVRPLRIPWSFGFPSALIHASESAVKQHADYAEAKAGNADAAVSLVQALLNPAILPQLRTWDTYQPILVSVHAEEEMGRNAIPEVMADVVADMFGWEIEANVVQANVVNHTGADGFSRLARQAIFAGDIIPGRNYVIVDDFVGQGGTIANLRGHVCAQGATVIGATVLTGKSFSATLSLEDEQLHTLRAHHGQLETWWQDLFGFGFDSLTQSEARYLVRTANADTIRDRILAAKQASNC